MPVGLAQPIDALRRLHDACDAGPIQNPVSFTTDDSALPIREPEPLPRYSQAPPQRDEADGYNPSGTQNELGLSHEPSALETELRTVTSHGYPQSRITRDN